MLKDYLLPIINDMKLHQGLVRALVCVEFKIINSYFKWAEARSLADGDPNMFNWYPMAFVESTGQGEEQELASKMLQIQSKRFYLDGKFWYIPWTSLDVDKTDKILNKKLINNL